MYRGTFTALVTPFTADNKVDELAFRKLIDFQFDNGVTGIVPVGTTGESPTLSHEEHQHVIALAARFADGRGPVIGGTGSNSTDEAIELTKAAEAAGCEAVLQVCPYYNKPSQEGLFQHFKAVADATSCRIILYSIPGRSGIEIGIDTTARLAAACPNIVSMKEAGGSVERVNQLVASCPDSFTTLSGDDTAGNVHRLCAKAKQPLSAEMLEKLGWLLGRLDAGDRRDLFRIIEKLKGLVDET